MKPPSVIFFTQIVRHDFITEIDFIHAGALGHRPVSDPGGGVSGLDVFRRADVADEPGGRIGDKRVCTCEHSQRVD
jgi:hypothetical protein